MAQRDFTKMASEADMQEALVGSKVISFTLKKMVFETVAGENFSIFFKSQEVDAHVGNVSLKVRPEGIVFLFKNGK